MSGVLRRRVVVPLLGVLRQGITPSRLAASIAIGTVISVFPIIGTTTALCAIVALAFRLNIVAIQVANFAAFPAQVLLLIPFLRLGERLAGAPRQPLTATAIVDAFGQGIGHALRTLSGALGHAAIGWGAAALPAAVVLFVLLRPVMGVVARRMTRAPAA